MAGFEPPKSIKPGRVNFARWQSIYSYLQWLNVPGANETVIVCGVPMTAPGITFSQVIPLSVSANYRVTIPKRVGGCIEYQQTSGSFNGETIGRTHSGNQ